MINLDKYFSEIESTKFCVEAGIANNLRQFEEVVRNSHPFIFLCMNIRDGGQGRAHGPDLVLERIKQLINTDFDHKYENPHDTALATYVMALDLEDHDAGMCAAQMLNDVKQIWWTRKIINKIQGLGTSS